MSWDAVVAHERSTSCCFCGARFDGFWVQQFQLLSGPEGLPLNLWSCGPCVPLAKTNGYGVAGTEQRTPRATRGHIITLAAAIVAAVILGAFVAIVFPVLVTR